jgi:membrane dipeptidase
VAVPRAVPPTVAGPAALSRRRLLRAGVLGGAWAIAAPMLNLGRCRWAAAADRPPVTVSTRAADLVLGATVIDMLGLLTADWPRLFRWQREPATFEEDHFRDLERSGVRIFHPAVDPDARDAHAGALRWMTGWNRLLDAGGCFLERVDTVDDLSLVAKRGRIGVVVGLQNSEHFRTVPDVAAFFRLGQRVSQLTYNERNRLGSGCYALTDRGLTAFGAEVVSAMNLAGMAIDISHCGERTSLEAIGLSRHPVLITHANCRHLVPRQPRCKSDAVIRAAAAKGGVMGITTVGAFVGGRPPTLARWLDHFDHVARIVGVEHVGLGSDIDVDARDPATGRTRPAFAIAGLEPAARVYQLADGLLARGWTGRDVELVLGGNFQRVLAEIWPRPPRSSLPAIMTRRDPFCPAPDRRPPHLVAAP